MLNVKEAKDKLFGGKWGINLRGELRIWDRPQIMGIINLTPDSFYRESRFSASGELLQRVGQMQEDGMDILDLGGASSRPGADLIPEKEELERVLPALRELRREFPALPISIDTYNAEVARQSIAEGADMINDISAGSLDPRMFEIIAETRVPYILMHMQGLPANMQVNPKYDDVVKEVFHFLSAKMRELRALGVNDLIADPGFGFGKTTDQNYLLLEKLDYFHELQIPLMVGVSRKRMINEVLGIKAAEALNGSTVVHTLALLRGAAILRVHDVKEAAQALKILTFTQKFS